MVPITWPQEFARFPASKRIAELNSGNAMSQSKFSDVCIIISSTNLHHQQMQYALNDRSSQLLQVQQLPHRLQPPL